MLQLFLSAAQIPMLATMHHREREPLFAVVQNVWSKSPLPMQPFFVINILFIEYALLQTLKSEKKIYLWL